jgi:hypothetical protein
MAAASGCIHCIHKKDNRVTFSVTVRQAARLAKNVGAAPLEPKPARPRRVTLDEKLCRAGWMPRYRSGIGHDYWKPAADGSSAGVAQTYMDARALALARIRRENAAPVE